MINKIRPFTNNVYFDVFSSSYRLLNSKEKNNLKLNIFISFCAGILEIFSVAAFYPLISTITEPGLIEKNVLIKTTWNLLGNPSQNQFVIFLALFIFIFLILSTFFNIYSQVLAVRGASSAEERFSNEFFSNILYSKYQWHLLNNPNLTRNIFLSNLKKWNNTVIRQIPIISGQISGIIFGCLTLLIATPKLGLILIIISILLLSILLRFIRKRSSKLLRKAKASEELINILLSETLNGIKDIKISSKENNFIKSFYKLNHIIIKNFAAATNWNLLPTYLVLLFGQLSILITALILFLIGIRGGELAAIMAIIVLIFSRIIPSLNRLGSSINNIANIYSWIEKINISQDNLQKNINNSYEKLPPSKESFYWNKVIFSSVNFKYPKSNNIILKNLNLEIKKGLNYAFVGYSGSGKSTALDLFLGLLEPISGNIYIDNKDLKYIGSKKWCQKISYVPQNPLITSGSLRENIAFGISNKNIDDEKVNHCLKQTKLYEIAKDLTNGIYTELGNDGILLSGGQKQRVAISRALYTNPEILILDEATSSLDLETERIIQKTLSDLSSKVTIISVAHRFSTIKNCDHIFVFKNGGIAAEGSYQELITTNKLFKRLAFDENENR